MKRFFKSTLLMIVAAAALLSSCNNKEPLKPAGSSLQAEPGELTFAAKDAASQQITITSDGEWIATAPEWITIDPITGSGNATITVTAADNVDESGSTQGPRSGKVVFALLENESINAAVKVDQEGDSALDTRHTYVKVDNITSGKAYLVVAIAANQDNSLVIPVLFGDTGTYGYPKSTPVEANADGSITLPDETNGLIFTEVEGGYTIQMYNSRYIWKQTGYKTWSCSLLGETPVESYAWAVAPRGDGTFEITLNGGILSYGSENYTTFSAYPQADEYTVYPFLYEDTKDVVLNTDYLSVNPKNQTVGASATEAEFAVSSNLAWTVTKKEGDWVKNFAESGSGDGKITVQFDANEGETERTATFTVASTDGVFSVDITLTQSGVVTSFDSIADVQASTDAEKTFNVKGTVAGVYSRGCLVTDGTGYILYYKNAAVDFVIGDEITISGVVSAYGGFNQFTAAAIVDKVGHKDDFAHPTAVGYDYDAFVAWYNAEVKTVDYVSFEGILTVDGSYYNIALADEGTTIARLQYATIENVGNLNGHRIAATGYTIGTTKNGDIAIVNVMMTTFEDKGAVLTETDHGATTIADFNAAPVSSLDWYQLTGKITNIDNPTYNDFYMEDETGSVYVYGLYKEKGAERIKNYVDSLGLEVNDTITIKALRTEYESTVQAGSAYYISHKKGTEPQPDLETYTSCAAVNAAILGGATKFILDPENFVEVTYINGSNVFVQDATGGLLLYGTGLESAGAYVGLRFKGAFTVTAKVFNGVPVISGIT
ncbi:MAG: BACON domain-containing protein, partial [Bacteroidales bacterium]|nr:BACON domain-containing protein [Candidatus Cryptobacteroides aphodequi]